MSSWMILGVIVVGAVALLVAGLIVQVLWNTTVPDIFGLREIAYWEAVPCSCSQACCSAASRSGSARDPVPRPLPGRRPMRAADR